MKLGFITPSVSRRSGGIFEIQRRLSQELHRLPDTEVAVFGLMDDRTHSDLNSWAPIEPKVFPHVGPSAFRFTPELTRAVIGSDCDLLHLHILWMATSLTTLKWGRSTKKPYVITLNGMLDPWALKHSGWKKFLARHAFERRNLTGAACVCVNSENELRCARNYGLKNPIAIIPNGVDLADRVNDSKNHEYVSSDSSAQLAPCFSQDRRRTLLYLGRIHPKKGLPLLMKAWNQLTDTTSASSVNGRPSELKSWRLAIAGWDELGHEAELKNLASELGLRWCDLRDKTESAPAELADILFLGPQFDDAKAFCYAKCEAFVLPSFSEGLPMAVLEAWAYGKPVLMTPQCNLPEGFSVDAAIKIDPTCESVALGLCQLAQITDDDRHNMGQRGKELVSERFTWPSVATKVLELSRWAVHGGDAPDFIVFN